MAGTINQTTLVTLKGLNQVYTSVEGDISTVAGNLESTRSNLQGQIDTLKAIYTVRGAVTWAELLALTSAAVNDVYILTTGGSTPMPSSLHAGDNLLCTQAFSSVITPADWADYWTSIGGLNNIASSTSAGILKVDISSLDTTNASGLTSVDRHLKIDQETDAGYVTIPAANTSTYGVVTTDAQTFAGNKTFQNNVTVTGNLGGGNASFSGVASFNNSVAFHGNVSFLDNANLTTVNTFTTQELVVGGITISSENGVISFSM